MKTNPRCQPGQGRLAGPALGGAPEYHERLKSVPDLPHRRGAGRGHMLHHDQPERWRR
jgi:hypothetical protein